MMEYSQYSSYRPPLSSSPHYGYRADTPVSVAPTAPPAGASWSYPNGYSFVVDAVKAKPIRRKAATSNACPECRSRKAKCDVELKCSRCSRREDQDDSWLFSPRRVRASVRPDREVVKNAEGKFICTFPGCANKINEFVRKCEWNKHMDKHDRPYKCAAEGCGKLPGFTYSGGLLRHEREVHGKHGGSKASFNCPYSNCLRHTGKPFSREDNLNEHLRRVHANRHHEGDVFFDSPVDTIRDAILMVLGRDQWRSSEDSMPSDLRETETNWSENADSPRGLNVDDLATHLTNLLHRKRQPKSEDPENNRPGLKRDWNLETLGKIAIAAGICGGLSLPAVAAQHAPPTAALHLAIGASIAASGIIPALRSNDAVPQNYQTAAYGTWVAAFTAFLVLELMRRPNGLQRRLLGGTVLFSSLNLLGTLSQNADSTLDGILNWGALALTASLCVIPVIMDYMSPRAAAEMAANERGVYVPTWDNQQWQHNPQLPLLPAAHRQHHG